MTLTAWLIFGAIAYSGLLMVVLGFFRAASIADDADEQILRQLANGDAPPVVQTSPHTDSDTACPR